VTEHDVEVLRGSVTAAIAQRLHDTGRPAEMHLAEDLAEDLADAVIGRVDEHVTRHAGRAAAHTRRSTSRALAAGVALGVSVTALAGIGSALALTSMIVLLGMAALGGWLLRALATDEEAVAVADQQRAYAVADQAVAAATQAALDGLARVLRADGHGQHLHVDADGAHTMVCPACGGPCRYAAALSPPVPALHGTVTALPRQSQPWQAVAP
jgi:hypothetical protein